MERIRDRGAGQGIAVKDGHFEEGHIPLQDGDLTIRTSGGTVTLCESGVDCADLGWLAYHRLPMYKDVGRRTPTIFIMNGGPSTPAIAHNGLLWGGPFTIPHDEDGHVPDTALPQFDQDSWLRYFDVVYFDPVGTGISKLRTNDMHWHLGVQKDAEITAAFIAWYMKNHAAENNSPIILAGSSYGSFRATGAALELAQQQIPTLGMVFFSGAHDRWLVTDYSPERVDPFVNILPAISMVNHFHGQSEDIHNLNILNERFRNTVEFSEGDYTDLLMDNVIPSRKSAIIKNLAKLTGLSPGFLREHNFRISPKIYSEERLRKQGHVLSILDGRLAYTSNGQRPIIDPKLDTIQDIFLSAITTNSSERGIPSVFQTTDYQGINVLSGPNWPYEGIWAKRNIAEAMAKLILLNPRMQIIDMSGYYDLNCPAPGQARLWRNLARAGLDIHTVQHYVHVGPPVLQDTPKPVNIDLICGPHGHQFAHDPSSRHALAAAMRTLGNWASLVHVLDPELNL